MGTSQSRDVEQEEQRQMESLYSILGVERDASEAELKKAYKRQALVLHPDRNFDNAEESTAKFARIQAAYDILSDPQERAWYDSHGSESGRGSQEPEYGGKITKTDEIKRYLDPVYFDAVDERPEELYDLVGRLFQQLAEEEHEAALDQGEQDPPHLPGFGEASSNWTTEIKPFYDVWLSFSSLKTFAWEDIYRSWDAQDRRSRRAMEIHNKKVRDAARNEFNDVVRTLVKLVRQKDPRVKLNIKKNKAKPADSNAKEQAKRDRKAQAEKRQNYQQQEWEKVDESEIVDDQVEEEDETVDLFECVVCDKIFKTKEQLSVHELSKKHIKNVRELKRQMRREGIELGFDDNEDEDEDEVTEDQVEEPGKEDKPEKKLSSEVDESFDSPVSDVEEDEEDDQQPNGNLKDPTLEELLSQLEGTRMDSRSETRSSTPTPKAGKAKQRRKKKEQSENEFANKCSVCQTVFLSRNKLFDHVKRSGHAAPKR
jgi:DnaJ family protein A protein 5